MIFHLCLNLIPKHNRILIQITMSNLAKPMKWRIVLQKCSGELYLHQLELDSNDTGVTSMQKLQVQYQSLKSSLPYRFWDWIILFRKPVVETATLSTVCQFSVGKIYANPLGIQNSSSNLEAQQEFRRVFLTRRQPDIELTGAFYSSAVLSSATNFVKGNAHFDAAQAEGIFGSQVLVIGLRMSLIGLTCLLLSNMLLCLGAGVVAYLMTRKVDLCVSVISSVAAVLSCVEAVLFLVCKWYINQKLEVFPYVFDCQYVNLAISCQPLCKENLPSSTKYELRQEECGGLA